MRTLETTFIARFASGKTLQFRKNETFKNRLAVYNYICTNRLAKKYGALEEIEEKTL